MNISLLITKEGSQVTLTPETRVEEQILEALHLEPMEISVKRAGEFSLTQGGYFREFDRTPQVKSTMLVLRKVANVGAATESSTTVPGYAIPGYETNSEGRV